MQTIRVRAGAGKNFCVDPNDKFIMARFELAILVDCAGEDIPNEYHRQLHKKLTLFLAGLAVKEQVRRGFKFNPPPVDIPGVFKYTTNIIRFSMSVEQNYHASASDRFLMEKYIGGDEFNLEDGETFESVFPEVFNGLITEMTQEIADIQRKRGILTAHESEVMAAPVDPAEEL